MLSARCFEPLTLGCGAPGGSVAAVVDKLRILLSDFCRSNLGGSASWRSIAAMLLLEWLPPNEPEDILRCSLVADTGRGEILRLPLGLEALLGNPAWEACAIALICPNGCAPAPEPAVSAPVPALVMLAERLFFRVVTFTFMVASICTSAPGGGGVAAVDGGGGGAIAITGESVGVAIGESCETDAETPGVISVAERAMSANTALWFAAVVGEGAASSGAATVPNIRAALELRSTYFDTLVRLGLIFSFGDTPVASSMVHGFGGGGCWFGHGCWLTGGSGGRDGTVQVVV